MIDFLFVIIELFRYLLWWRHYKRKSVEVGIFQRGWVTLRLNFKLKGYVSRQYLWTIRYGNGIYNFAAGSFHTKKLCSRLYLTEIGFYSKNEKVTF